MAGPQVKITEHARQILGRDLPREGMVKAFNGLNGYLPLVTDEQRAEDRIKLRPSCFQFNYNFRADGWGWGIACVVDDSEWPDRVIVVDVIVCRGKRVA